MFKYKLSYFFRHKTKLEKHLTHLESFKVLDKGGMSSLLICLGWILFTLLSLTFISSIPIFYDYVAKDFVLDSFSPGTLKFFINFGAATLSLGGIAFLFLSVFLFFEQVTPIHLFRYIYTRLYKKYTKKTFTKDVKKLLPILQTTGFNNQESTDFINECINSSAYYYYIQPHHKKLKLGLKNFYTRDSYKNSKKIEDNVDISNTINNFYLQKEISQPSLVKIASQEQEITFFAKEKMEHN